MTQFLHNLITTPPYHRDIQLPRKSLWYLSLSRLPTSICILAWLLLYILAVANSSPLMKGGFTMFCDKCDVKMRPYRLKGSRQLHSCPKCGYTLITDITKPYNLPNQIQAAIRPPASAIDRRVTSNGTESNARNPNRWWLTVHHTYQKDLLIFWRTSPATSYPLLKNPCQIGLYRIHANTTQKSIKKVMSNKAHII